VNELTICINKVDPVAQIDATIYALGYPVQADEHVLLLSSYTRPAAPGHLQPAAAEAAAAAVVAAAAAAAAGLTG
jgi:hypothetical protein